MARAKKSPTVPKTPAVSPPPVVELGKCCGIRDGAQLKRQLLDLLGRAESVTIDPTAIERIDTAAIQLLFAFERDRLAAGREVTWRTPTAAFSQAVATLGLKLGAAAPATS
jgi:anti-anti-sigma regulatory factor